MSADATSREPTPVGGSVLGQVDETGDPAAPTVGVVPAIAPLALLGPAGASCEGDSCSF